MISVQVNKVKQKYVFKPWMPCVYIIYTFVLQETSEAGSKTSESLCYS